MALIPDSQEFTTAFMFTATLENYATVLRSDYTRFFFNNLIVSVAAVLVSLVVGVPAAYALARFQFKLKEDIAFTILSFRFAPEILVILPLYLIYQRIVLYHTYLGLIWVYQLITLPLLIWILRGFFEDISPDIEAAPPLDGDSWWQVFLQVLLPLVQPGLVAAGLLCFIFAWNAFTFPLLLSNNVQTSTLIAPPYLPSH